MFLCVESGVNEEGEAKALHPSCPLCDLLGRSFHGLATLFTWTPGFSCPTGGDFQYGTAVPGSFIQAPPSDQFSSVAQSSPTLCDPMNHSTPGLPVHHQLLEFTQTHAH